MSYCKNCGTKVDEGVKFCPSCGSPMGAPAPEQQAQQNTAPADFSAGLAGLNNTADITGEFNVNDINNNKAMGILAYFGPLCFIPIFAAKDSKFARFHANQGLLLFIACVAWSIVYGILTSVILTISWRLYFLVSIIGLISVVFLVLAVIGIINAAGGRAKELPVIGKFRLLK